MKYVYINSMSAEPAFQSKDKFTMIRTIKYFLTYMSIRRPFVKWDEFTWEIAGMIEQKDTFSCAIFVMWFMEHWTDGHIPEFVQSKYVSSRNLLLKREEVLARILLQPENKYRDFLIATAQGKIMQKTR